MFAFRSVVDVAQELSRPVFALDRQTSSVAPTILAPPHKAVEPANRQALALERMCQDIVPDRLTCSAASVAGEVALWDLLSPAALATLIVRALA